MFRLIKSIFGRKERKAIERIRKYQTVYNTPDGKWVLEDIMALCKYGESGLGKDTEHTYFKLGMQNIGIELAQLLTASISKLEEEAKKEEEMNDEQDV